MSCLRRLRSFCCAAAVLTACSKPDTEAADTAAVAPPAAPAPAPLSLAQVAGRWNGRAVPETGTDTTPTTFVLTTTADTTGWSIAVPNRQPIPTRVVAVGGDSIVTETGPYESSRRRGVRVTTRVVWRMEGDRLIGSAVARYVTTGPDSVLRLRYEATRAP
jgi:hypothetical protein